jgi:hypothetical protein
MIKIFFDMVNAKFQSDLANLLTVEFQIFDNFNAQNYGA